MDTVSLCPLRVLGFVYCPRPGTFAQTIIVKATFELRPGTSVLASEQDAPNEEDNHWNDDPSRSVYAPSDMAPFKPKADLMLVGHAFAPGKIPARSVMARLVIGNELDKSIEVWCDRGFTLQNGQLLEGKAFTKMPLRWERAAGGPDSDNPVGMRFDAAPDRYGMVAIPNLQPAGILVSQRSDTFASICFAPVPERWPLRSRRLGRHAGIFNSKDWMERPIPEDLDYSYFQTAAPDQQVNEIRGNERIVLENLHPEHERLVTNLPGIWPRAVVDRATGEREEVALVADTLWIDTDRGICTMVWRGRVGLRHATEAGRVAVSIEGDAAESEVPTAANRVGALRLGVESEGRKPEAMDVALMTMVPSMTGMPGAVMPFQEGSGSVHSLVKGPPPVPGRDGALPFGRDLGKEMIPAAVDAQRVPGMLMAAAPVLSLQAAVAPPPMVARAAGVEVAKVNSPWASGSQVTSEPAPMSLVPKMPGGTVDLPAGVPTHDGIQGYGSVIAASNAAAASSKRVISEPAESQHRQLPRLTQEKIKPTNRATVEFVWADPEMLHLVRRHPAWKKIIADIRPKSVTREPDEDVPPEKRPELKMRRDILGIMTRGETTEANSLEDVLSDAVAEDGAFTPPLVLLMGELEFPFDELETLRATIAVLTPLAAGDKKLKETIDGVNEVLQAPYVQGSASVVEGLTARLKEAFARGTWSLPARYIETHTERMLLGQRHYQKRKLLKKTWIRSLFVSGGGQGIPTYLPDSLAEELPMFPRFRVRLIAEVHTQIDQQESSGYALRGVGVGRMVTSR